MRFVILLFVYLFLSGCTSQGSSIGQHKSAIDDNNGRQVSKLNDEVSSFYSVDTLKYKGNYKNKEIYLILIRYKDQLNYWLKSENSQLNLEGIANLSRSNSSNASMIEGDDGFSYFTNVFIDDSKFCTIKIAIDDEDQIYCEVTLMDCNESVMEKSQLSVPLKRIK